MDALICGGIGMGGQIALAEGTYDPNARCDHRDAHPEGSCGHHHHGGEGGHVYGDEECGHNRSADHHCHGN